MNGVNVTRWAREWASSGRLTKPEGDVIKELASYAGDRPVAWPCNATLAASVQCVEKTVRRALDGLEEKGLISRSRDLVGRVLRSREHPIVMCVEVAATPAEGQLQLDLGDQALVTADHAPRRVPAAPAAVPAAPAPRHPREVLAEQATHLGAALAALNAAAEVSSDDPGRGTTLPPVVGRPPEVPEKNHMEKEKGEGARERALTASSTVVSGIPDTFTAVLGELRAEFGAQADIFDSAIAQTLRAHPEPDGYDHVAAARMVVAAQHTAAAMGWKPITVLSTKLAAELAKQRGPVRQAGRPPTSRRRGDRGHDPAKAKAKAKRFVKRSSVEDAAF